MSKIAPLRWWSPEPLTREVRLSLEKIARMDDVVAVAAMPDAHLTKKVCVGAVVATRKILIPDAVGGDIGCGMAAICFDGLANEMCQQNKAEDVLAMLKETIPIRNHESRLAELPDELSKQRLSSSGLESKKNGIGRTQFATLGRGNHFVEFQTDVEGNMWVMIHSGSRGMGQAIREHHTQNGQRLSQIDSSSGEGSHYLLDLGWALNYARLSRKSMLQKIVDGIGEILGIGPLWDSYIDCHHNFARLEEHGNEMLWVHRKGAISATLGEKGIIPGTMGTSSFHVEGRGNVDSFCSSSHGAGRLMSRTEARKKVSLKNLKGQMQGVWFDKRVADRLRDEAPSAYKDIGRVMRAQKKLTRIVRRLEPLLVYKGV